MRAPTTVAHVILLSSLSLCLGAACARSGHAEAEAREPVAEPVADASSRGGSEEAGSPAVEEPSPELRREPLSGASEHFRAASVDGAFVLRREGEPDRTYGGELVDDRRTPCSTYKIPNALIALEVGALDGVDVTLPWDGVKRRFESWNHEHDLRTAMRDSVVWYFQEVARRIGLSTMTSWVERLEYGDQKIGEQVDMFWLEGPLSISAAEQVHFVDRLVHDRLPLSEGTMSSVRSIVPEKSVGDVTIRAKTGTCVFEDGRPPHAWLVGWVERGDASLGSFALLLTEGADVNALVNARWSLAFELLGEAGLIDRTKVPGQP